jgi:hypothetical protein
MYACSVLAEILRKWVINAASFLSPLIQRRFFIMLNQLLRESAECGPVHENLGFSLTRLCVATGGLTWLFLPRNSSEYIYIVRKISTSPPFHQLVVGVRALLRLVLNYIKARACELKIVQHRV